jgi:hypothetical protein
MGVGIWLLSFPLLTEHAVNAASAATPAPAVLSADYPDPGARQFRNVRPPLTIGELGVPAVAELVRPVVIAPPPPPRPVPAPRPVPPPAPPAPAPATVSANTLYIPSLNLRQHVSDYTDCTGNTGIPHWDVWRWTCAGTNNTYIMAHNPGVFTPILGLHVGDLIQYGDPAGVVHTYKVTFTEIVSYTDTSPTNALAVPSITLQTCWNYDGTQDFIVRAVEI